ncbi:RHS repeat-associated core domain-containing protein [Pantoea sp. App145]|uniref:RHS repeat-associated core domain-containing protein n=1 Tax=Pantoea sp. App145 TaxID=3071567 RepID=UPI003A808A33
MNTSLFSHTPTVKVHSNRGLDVRHITYYRHPDTPDATNERVIRHQYNACGFLTQSADPRLHDAGLVNFTWLTDLAGIVLRTQSVDTGTTVALNDAADRPVIVVSDISTSDTGTEDKRQAVTRTRQYEDAELPGRPLSVTEQVAGGAVHITERFVYAGNTEQEKARNLAGHWVSYYDTAGLTQMDSLSLTDVPLSVTRHLLKNADTPDTRADWQGKDTSVWNTQLDDEPYITLSTLNATGAVLTTTDAKGNVQHVAYDVAGLLSGSWLTLKNGTGQVIVKSLTYSAAGQKLREEHGNGVVTTYIYEPETQRLAGIKTERPSGHPAGTKVLQDLRYEYDPVGNLLIIGSDAEESRFYRNQKVVPENTYTYDSLYQLVSATGREMANAGQQDSHLPSTIVPVPADSAAWTNYTRTYTYDCGGNLTQMRHSAPATNNRYTTRITVSDRSNRGVLSSLTTRPSEVDALFTVGGQQTQLQPGQPLSWTPCNELLQVVLVARDGGTDDRESYRYDANRRRILKVSTQKTGNSTQTQRVVYLPGLELRTTKSGDTESESLHVICVGEAGRAQVRVLEWESGKPADITNDMVRYSYDNLTGSSGFELDSNGNVISTEEYYPYGGTAVWAARCAVEASYKTIRYSGKERDATGLYYYGFRYYQPWAGRWLSTDPAGTVDGLNLYRMVRNNPVTLIDNDGLVPLKPEGFKWVTSIQEGKAYPFAGMSLLSIQDNLPDRVEFLKNAKIASVISLENEEFARTKKTVTKGGLVSVEFFIKDWHAPSADHLYYYNTMVDALSVGDRRVVTHCWGGFGRTGVFLASRLIYKGIVTNAQDALKMVRENYNKHAVEMKAQYNALARFADKQGLAPSMHVDKLPQALNHWDASHGEDGMAFDPGHAGDKRKKIYKDKKGKIINHQIMLSSTGPVLEIPKSVIHKPVNLAAKAKTGQQVMKKNIIIDNK